ncbi:UDP:flavonoid glycosyltransferase YjiC (YdhE family) [Streptomyces sp. PvR006]|uniref:nucleotide disphospho-sugar-binding domain-containing protein n=1 Tax=Streptomyces sp. PvR006 TaxID=2817860 RepID=UPI001AE915E9|nr:glycosyltransferase [Streptomyces sp. PvR006]MBP2579740.1 UDP:flavonoid glycosyltransferase YjiC (YdhE family) [Streptomyces sp. PvR006]
MKPSQDAPAGRAPRVAVVSPPFLSHAQPLSVLARALAGAGAEVLFVSAPAFAPLAEAAGARFVPLTVTRNANTGIARSTRQGAREAERLEEFLGSTRQGAVAALLTQSRHRGEDMLADPAQVVSGIGALQERCAPDWYVVDQLSYPVTLALHCLGLPYATFCPGHPTYLPHSPEALFGVPYAWPLAIRPTEDSLAELRRAAHANDVAFTRRFAEIARAHAPARAPGRAFALASRHAVVFNYPRFPWLPERQAGETRYLYGGHCSPDREPGPGAEWEGVVRRLRASHERVVLIALGTFLSARTDVLSLLVRAVRAHVPGCAVVVAAGDGAASLAHLSGPDVHVADVVPQRWLLRQVDAMVHHGGNNSFTECLASATPALILPFSSDQFSIAHDAERAGLALSLDPSRLEEHTVGAALRHLLAEPPGGLPRWTRAVRRRGPDWMARRLLRTMNGVTIPAHGDGGRPRAHSGPVISTR